VFPSPTLQIFKQLEKEGRNLRTVRRRKKNRKRVKGVNTRKCVEEVEKGTNDINN